MYSKCARLRRRALSPNFKYLAIIRGPAMPLLHQAHKYSEEGPKKPSTVEPVDPIKIPGFITPENKNEEGFFTQKAAKDLEELKKNLGKNKPIKKVE